MTNVEQTTAPKARGSLPRKPQSTFNPLGADKVLRADDAAIVAAYREAVSKVDMKGKPFTLTDEQILVTVRSVSGPTTEDLEGRRINALLKATGVEHTSTLDVAAASAHATHHAEAVEAAKKIPESVLTALRQITEAQELTKIAPLLVRQKWIDAGEQDYLRTFTRVGAKEGVKDENGILHNNCEYYKDDYKDKDGVTRSKFYSRIADAFNESPDGVKQLEQIELHKKAANDMVGFGHEHFPGADEKSVTDGLAKWRMRNKTSITVMRQAFQIEQLMAELERDAPNVQVQVKYKRNAQGEKTNELRNSLNPIIIVDKNDLDATTQLSIRDFLRLKVSKAAERVPAERKEAGPNVMLLKSTLERKEGAPNRGQGKQQKGEGESVIAALTSGRKAVNVHTMRDLLTITLPNFFVVPTRATVNEKREARVRVMNLKSLLATKEAEQDVLILGELLRDMNAMFAQFAAKYETLMSQKIDAEEKEAEIEQNKQTAA